MDRSTVDRSGPMTGAGSPGSPADRGERRTDGVGSSAPSGPDDESQAGEGKSQAGEGNGKAAGRAPGIGPAAAASLAELSFLPTSGRAVLDYYATTGTLAVGVVRLQRRVDAFVQGVIDDAFDPVKRAIAEGSGVDVEAVSFEYDTKLTMPAELTLGHIYQRAADYAPKGNDPVPGPRRIRDRLPFVGSGGRGATPESDGRDDTVERAEAVTELVVVALLDGDMRDAINDDEYEDFRVAGADGIDRERAATIAQETLRARVEELFAAFPDAVRDAYRDAVDRSEAHQDRDPYFRDLLAAAGEGNVDAVASIRDEYKYGDVSVTDGDGSHIRPSALFVDSERTVPYLETQYGRVGVIYDGMIEMYRAAGVDVEDAFKRSIVFTIIGAQIWLDDIDDYRADLADGQLTPVTAEYLLAESEREAYREVVDVTTRYLDAAERYAAETNSPLAGIGANYVFRKGDPSALPGHEYVPVAKRGR